MSGHLRSSDHPFLCRPTSRSHAKSLSVDRALPDFRVDPMADHTLSVLVPSTIMAIGTKLARKIAFHV